MKRRTKKRRASRVKKLGSALSKALERNQHVRGNIFDVPAVKRAHARYMAATPYRGR